MTQHRERPQPAPVRRPSLEAQRLELAARQRELPVTRHAPDFGDR